MQPASRLTWLVCWDLRLCSADPPATSRDVYLQCQRCLYYWANCDLLCLPLSPAVHAGGFSGEGRYCCLHPSRSQAAGSWLYSDGAKVLPDGTASLVNLSCSTVLISASRSWAEVHFNKLDNIFAFLLTAALSGGSFILQGWNPNCACVKAYHRWCFKGLLHSFWTRFHCCPSALGETSSEWLGNESAPKFSRVPWGVLVNACSTHPVRPCWSAVTAAVLGACSGIIDLMQL